MLNLGGLFFTLDADTRGLINSQRRVEQFAQTVRNAFNGVNRGTVAPQFANQLLRQERAVVQMLERIKALQQQVSGSNLTGANLTAAQAQLQSLGRAYDNFTRKMAGGVPLNNLDFNRRMMHMRSQISDTTREVARLQATAANTGAFRNFTGVLQGLGTSSLVIQGHLGGMSTRFLALSHLVREFGVVAAVTSASIAGLTAGIGLMAITAVKAGRELQGLTVGFTALTGNIAVAGQHLQFVREVAEQAGLTFTDSARGWMRFIASAQVGGLTLQQSQEAFRGVSLAAATMMLSVEDTQGVFRALDQILSKGTVQAEELRGQLGDRLPGAFVIAARAMGVTTAELNKMLKAGEVVSAEFVPKFVETLQRLWNINPEAPINTLTASLNRLSNEWTYFGQNLDRATGATRVFQGAVEGIIRAFRAISANLPDIISWMGALTGALIGLAAAWAINTVIQFIAALGGVGAAMTQLITIVRGLVTGVITLNTVLLANPVVRLITVFVSLAGALGGAKLGYDLLTEAVQRNMNATAASINHIQAYVDAQRGMEFQVRSTTQAMMEQVAAQNAIDAAAAQQALADAGQARAGSPSFMDWFRGGFDPELARAQQARRAQESLQQADSAIEKARRTARLYDELNQILKKPDMPASPVEMLADDDDGRKLTDNINRIEDYILRMQNAQERLRDITERGAAGQSYKLVDDLFAAREALNQLNPKQLAAVDVALRAAGFSAGSLEARLGAVFTITRQAEEAARVYINTWEELRDSEFAFTELQKQISLLNDGVDPGKIDSMFRPFARANDFLKDLDANSEAGRQALLGLRDAMVAMGVPAEETGNLFEDVRSQLAAFLQQEMMADQLVGTLSDLNKEIRDIREETQDLQTLTNIFGSNSPLAAFAGEEAQKALARAAAIRQLTRDMENQGASQEMINQRVAEYRRVLEGLDEAEYMYDRARDKAESFRNSIQDVVSTAVNGFRDVVSGIKSVGDALNSLTDSILNGMWQNFILNPINDLIANIGRSSGGGGEGLLSAIGSGVASIFGGAKGRAFGGNMFPGQMYQINEQGISGEYFIPAVSGYMSPTPANDRGGAPVMIDARTTIDARGATLDTIEALRREMASRDQRLRRELPLIVDSRVIESTNRGRY